MKKLIFTIITILGLTTCLSAQYVDQALRFSQQNYGSTARSKAMGNAFGALGGDFSALSINPSGIAIYQRSEVSASVNLLNLNNTETTYQGQTGEDRSNKFNFSNFGYVVSAPQVNNSTSGLVALNFGIGFNRLNNFNQDIFTNSFDSPHSRIDAFASNTNAYNKGRGIDYYDLGSADRDLPESDPNYYNPYNTGLPWESIMAYNTYLINPQEGETNYYDALPGAIDRQKEAIDREGIINEYLVSFGANFNHQFYIGGTVGLHDLYFDEIKTYREEGEFGNFYYGNRATTSGFGYNLKLGAIFRPIPELRLGAAIHTPTFYKLNESYYAQMNSNLNIDYIEGAYGEHSEESSYGDYEYKMETPFRAIGSIAYQFGKKGLISFDYEYIDYSSIKYRSANNEDYNWSFENQDMKEIYTKVNNIRLGAEYRVTESLSLRGGIELMGNPYNANAYNISQPNKGFKFTTYNGGIGYRNNNLSLDLSYSLGDRTNYMYIYQAEGFNVEPVKYHSLVHELMFTLGIRL